MKKKFLMRSLFLFWLSFFSFLTYAQQESAINNISALYKSEISKAGIPADQANIKLIIAGNQDLKKYDLNEKPADAFYIKANNQSLEIRSQTIDGLRNGVYWYLDLIGFRFYFPGEIWQHIPQLQSDFKQVEKTVSPSFLHRRIWYAYGTGSKKADADYKKWFDANLLGGVEINAGHAYDGIVNRNKNIFLQHPEYFAQKVQKGKIPPNPKFEPANEKLVQLLIDDALHQIETRTKRTGELPGMISMDPSDGGGFSTSPAALKIGGPSEQTFYLANRVAAAVRVKYPAIKIGLYAYNLHAAPPQFDLEPNIVVLVATAMNQSAYRTDELITLWKKKGVEVGIRDYYGVMAWDWDMPGQPRGGRFEYIKQLIDHHNTGVRYFSAETNIGWISRGPGHYAAAKLLWNRENKIEDIEHEFYKNMFGRASGEIRKLYQSWQNYSQPIPLDGDIYTWSQCLETASQLENDSRVQQRIDHIKQYLHYVVLYKQWIEKNTDGNLVQLLNYAYRVQDDGIVASYPLFRRLANAAVAGKKNMRFNDPDAVWKKNNHPLNHEETNRLFYADIKSLNHSERMEASILPAEFKINKKNTKGINETKSSLPVRLRGGHKIIIQLQGKDASINLTQGLIKAHQYKTLRLNIYPYNKDLVTSGKEPLLTGTILPKQPLKSVSLSALKPGIYIAEIDDARNGFSMSFTGDVNFAIMGSGKNKLWTFGRNNLVFDVEEIQEFKITNEGVLTLVSPLGRVIDLQKQKGTFTINVQKGEEGIWKLQRQSGKFYIEGILPFFNADSQYLLHN